MLVLGFLTFLNDTGINKNAGAKLIAMFTFIECLCATSGFTGTGDLMI